MMVVLATLARRPAADQVADQRKEEPPAGIRPNLADAPPARAEGPHFRWPALSSDQFPGLPPNLNPPPREPDLAWAIEGGEQWSYDVQLHSSATLSPLRLGPKAQQVLQFRNERKVDLKVRVERRDLDIIRLQFVIERIRGKLQAATGRLEYDSGDVLGLVPETEPLRRFLRRPWVAVVGQDRRIVRLEWADGAAMSSADRAILERIMPLRPVPRHLQPGSPAAVTVGEEVVWTRWAGVDQQGRYVLVQVRRRGTEETERAVVVIAPADGGVVELHTVHEDREGTGLPSVGRFRPLLRTLAHAVRR